MSTGQDKDVAKRDPLFDVAKFVAMFMVVYWHVMSYRPGFDLATMPSCAANFIIAVNMPLFFVVSGYFSRRLHYSGNWRKLAGRMVSYFWPLAIFSIIGAVIDAFLIHKCTIASIPLVALKKFLFTGWFFYALAGCEIITFCATRYSRSVFQKVEMCCLAYFMMLFLSGRVWYASSIVSMVPFYWFGLYLLPYFLSRKKLFSVTAICGGLLMIYITYFAGSIATNGLAFYWDRFDILHPEWTKAINMSARYLVGMVGVVFILGFLKMIVLKVPVVSQIAFLGTETLCIYYVHGHLVRLLSNRFVNLYAGSCVLLFSTCIVFGFSFLIVKLTKVTKLMEALVWGFRLHNNAGSMSK